MNDQISTEKISCEWCGRHGDSVKVIGASSIPEARKAAIEFAELPEGIMLDEGKFEAWPYEEPQPDDWKDHFIFRSEDEYQPDTREWWEK